MHSAGAVLVVEDDAELAEMLSRLLRRWFGLIVVARSAADGRAAIRAVLFDVVLTDFDLPDGTGVELLRLAAEVLPGARRILWSGNPPAFDDAHCAHTVLSKPIDLARLRSALRGGEP
jgi:two-component system response regulator PilR (NtrC family)